MCNSWVLQGCAGKVVKGLSVQALKNFLAVQTALERSTVSKATY